MDLDTHESHPLECDKDEDAMDTSLDLIQSYENTDKQQLDRPLDPAPLAFQNSDVIHEPPREGESPAALPEYNGKTSCRLSANPFSSSLC